ncbi:hypothetical protein [Actinomycetospora atypica]|uniref:Uncharacterized protein n=1 Tax=Actinomycetospora atypica TaxID=1290095 RepID=A0ABV9YN55_9PSEU
MSDEADKTAQDRTGDAHPGGAEGNGPTDIPESSPSSESENSLDKQAAKRDGKDG